MLVGAGLIGDGRLSPAQVEHLRVDGADWVGMVGAVVIAIGLRSGARGGPIALERAEVRHVLLAPVDRTTAMRGPALRQLRFLLFAGAVVGTIGGVLAAHRLPGSGAAWAFTGMLLGLTIVALGYGAALCASGLRFPSWLSSLLGLILVAWAVADGLNAVEGSPTVVLGRLAFWPLEFSWLGLIPIVLGVALCLLGFTLVGNLSYEQAERRSTLVGQLRFAATLQDIRTVLVLRRQLAMELPRLRPWIRVRVRGTGRLPVWTRGVRGVLRWPAARVARLVLLGIVAGLALRGAWIGTSPLVVVAGLAMFVAGLDAVEPLAQEVDHPTRRDSVPIEAGAVEVRHLAVAMVAMVLVALVGAVAGVLVGVSSTAVELAALCVLPAAAGAVAGATVSVVAGAPTQAASGDTWSLMPPEVAGMRLAFRTGWPPALAIIGCLPILAGRTAARHGVDAVPATAAAAAGVILVFVLVAGWVRQREHIHAWWRSQMELAGSTRRGEVAADAG